MKRRKESPKAHRHLGMVTLAMMLAAALVLSAAVGISYVRNRDFQETFYELTSNKVLGRLRIIQISDLHAVLYDRLLNRVERLNPDLIVLTGDIVDRKTQDVTDVVTLCGELTAIAPVYYIYGNHERNRQYGTNLTAEDIREIAEGQSLSEDQIDFYSLIQDDLRQQMEAAGVTVLLNRQATVQIGDTPVDIFGVLTGSFEGFYRYAEDAYYQYAYENMENFKLLLLHEPYLTEWIPSENWGDLILCGHTHGGMIRIPGIGGVYETMYGVFPEWLRDGKIKGLYETNGIPLIVSSGLSNRDLWRIHNQPELVVIDINPY